MSGLSQNVVRMIAIDMDGTLLGEDGKVSARNLSALQSAEAAGIHVVVATGRRHSYALRVLRSLDLDPASALVSSNGAVTRTLGSASVPTELIARTHLPNATAGWLFGHLGEYRNALVVTYDRVGPDGEDVRGALVVEHLADLHASIGKWMTANEPYIARIQPIELALEASVDAPIQMMLCGTVARMTAAEAHLRALGEADGDKLNGFDGASKLPITLHRTEYPLRDLSILDILPMGCSKGSALLSLAATRGIEATEILAIGDNWNDVSMLEMAGTAVLMANAPEDLKLVALERGWQIGSANTADGVAEAIEPVLVTCGEVVPC